MGSLNFIGLIIWVYPDFLLQYRVNKIVMQAYGLRNNKKIPNRKVRDFFVLNVENIS